MKFQNLKSFQSNNHNNKIVSCVDGIPVRLIWVEANTINFLMISELVKDAIQVPSTDSAVIMVMVCDTAGITLLCNTCKTPLILCNLAKNYSVLDFPINWYQYLYLQIHLSIVLSSWSIGKIWYQCSPTF